MGLFCASWNLFNCNVADFYEWWLVNSLQKNSPWQKEELYKKNCHVYIALKSPSTKDLKLNNPSSTQFVSPLKIVNLKSNQTRTGWGSGDIHHLSSIFGNTLNISIVRKSWVPNFEPGAVGWDNSENIAIYAGHSKTCTNDTLNYNSSK